MVPAGQFVRSVAYISRRFKRPLVFIGDIISSLRGTRAGKATISVKNGHGLSRVTSRVYRWQPEHPTYWRRLHRRWFFHRFLWNKRNTHNRRLLPDQRAFSRNKQNRLQLHPCRQTTLHPCGCRMSKQARHHLFPIFQPFLQQWCRLCLAWSVLQMHIKYSCRHQLHCCGTDPGFWLGCNSRTNDLVWCWCFVLCFPQPVNTVATITSVIVSAKILFIAISYPLLFYCFNSWFNFKINLSISAINIPSLHKWT